MNITPHWSCCLNRRMKYPADSTVQNPFRDANTSLAKSIIPRILWSPKVHRCVYNSLSLVSILNQLHLAHYPQPPSLRHILILFYYLSLGLSSGLFPSGFLAKTLYTFLFSLYLLHAAPISAFLIWLPKSHWRVAYYKLWSFSLCNFLHSPISFSLSGCSVTCMSILIDERKLFN